MCRYCHLICLLVVPESLGTVSTQESSGAVSVCLMGREQERRAAGKVKKKDSLFCYSTRLQTVALGLNAHSHCQVLGRSHKNKIQGEFNGAVFWVLREVVIRAWDPVLKLRHWLELKGGTKEFWESQFHQLPLCYWDDEMMHIICNWKSLRFGIAWNNHQTTSLQQSIPPEMQVLLFVSSLKWCTGREI
jgi:hypothetical protein